MRIDDQTEVDPFGVHRAVLRQRHAQGPDIRSHLLLCEAIELAHGRRHLTIVHGDPHDIAASRYLSDFYEEMRRIAAGCEWVRVRGNAEYVTVTVGGLAADEQIAMFEAAAALSNPGAWTIVATAVPPLS